MATPPSERTDKVLICRADSARLVIAAGIDTKAPFLSRVMAWSFYYSRVLQLIADRFVLFALAPRRLIML